MIHPKNKSEDLLLSKTKNCEKLIEQTHRKSEKTLGFKLNKSRKTFHFNLPVEVKESWMIGLRKLEVYNSFFNITEENKKFELYKFPDEKAGGISYEKVRIDIEKVLDIPDIKTAELQDDTIGPNTIEEFREKVTKRKENVGYRNVISGYPSSVFQDFESYLRTEIDLVEDDSRLVLDKINSCFITSELKPGIYTFKDLSEALLNILQLENPASSSEIVIEIDDIRMKTKLVVNFGIIAIRFDKKLFFSTVLGFTAGWDYKHYN